MTVVRFDGAKDKDKSVTTLQVTDINGVERKLAIGDTVDLSDNKIVRLRKSLKLPNATDPTPTAQVSDHEVKYNDIIGDDGKLKSVFLPTSLAALPWRDDFVGATGSAPDPRSWTPEHRRWAEGGEKQFYAAPNAVLDGQGHLKLVANREAAPDGQVPSGTAGHYGYTSGRVHTFGKQLFTPPVRLEARVKVPAGKGLLPAFWLMGATDPTLAGTADLSIAQAGEIDIMEAPSIAVGDPLTLSSSAYGPQVANPLLYVGAHRSLVNTTKLSDDFHIYGLDWRADSVQAFIDGVPVGAVMTRAEIESQGGVWVLNHPMYLILSVAVGNNWTGDPVEPATIFPATMLVDWVRATMLAPSDPPGARRIGDFSQDFDGRTLPPDWRVINPPGGTVLDGVGFNNGTLDLPTTVAGNYSGLQFQGPWSMDGSQVSWRVARSTGGIAGEDYGMDFIATPWSQGELGWHVDSGVPKVRYVTPATGAVEVDLAYTTAAEPWTRIRDTGSALVWESSVNGTVWTQRHSIDRAIFAGVAGVGLVFGAMELYAGNYQGNTAGSPVRFADLNLPS